MKNKNFKKGFVYMVKQLSTGKIYIGQQSKWYSQGLKPEEIMGIKYWTSNPSLAAEWKANPDDFAWVVLRDDIVDKRELDWLEARYIFSIWKSHRPCWNKLINLRLAKRKEDELPGGADVR